MLRIFPWLQFWNTEKHISFHFFLFWLITWTSNKKYKHYLTVNIKNNTTHIRKRVWVKKVRPKYSPFFCSIFLWKPCAKPFFLLMFIGNTYTDRHRHEAHRQLNNGLSNNQRCRQNFVFNTERQLILLHKNKV